MAGKNGQQKEAQPEKKIMFRSWQKEPVSDSGPGNVDMDFEKGTGWRGFRQPVLG
jgi:hypothetical protein